MAKKYSSTQILKMFMYEKHVMVKFLLPTIFIKKLEFVYLMIYRNSVEFTTVFNFIFYIGLDIFFRLTSVYKVRSFVEMMKVSKYIRNSVVDYVKNCNNDDMLIPMDIYNHISHQFRIRKWKGTDIANFKTYVKKNKNRLINDAIIMNIDIFDLLLKSYEKDTLNS